MERYEILKRHIHEEAARVIAEAFPTVDHLLTRDYLDARLAEQTARMEGALRAMESSIHRWMLTFMGSLWLGVAGLLVAIVLKG